MKKKSFLMALFILVTVFNITPLMAQACKPVEVDKWLHCPDGEGWSDNPPYYVGQKYYFWMVYEVKANVDLTDVVVYDRFGAELMIEGIAVLWDPTVKNEDYDYNFTYVPYARDGVVRINDVPEGFLNETGVEILGTGKGDFHIFWTGNSVKVHFQWDIGDMDAGDRMRIWVIVSTDTNPAGKQEYTSCGKYMLNSGATVKGFLATTGKKVSAVSNTIEIEVLCCD